MRSMYLRNFANEDRVQLANARHNYRFMHKLNAYMVSFLHGIVSRRLLNAQLRYKT